MKRSLLAALGIGLSACSQGGVPPAIIFPMDGAVVRSPLKAEAQGQGTWRIDGREVGRSPSLEIEITPGQYELSYGSSRVTVTVRNEENSGAFVPVSRPVTVNQAQLFSVIAPQAPVTFSSGLQESVGHPSTEVIKLITDQNPLLERITRLTNAGVRPARPSTRSLSVKEREFKVNNLQGGVITLKAEMLEDTGSLVSWIQADASGDQRDAALETARRFQDERRSLMHQFFGSPADVDGDGRVHLLFSSSLNDSGLAVGFFDPSDLLDPRQAGGNGMEILYLGIPDSTFNYSPDSLLATTCHEYQHLINFSRKSLPLIYSGQLVTETVAVNEGLSHLAEDLCGLNVRGGNVAFVSAALDANGTGSFSDVNAQGEGDTPERRGLAYLHLRRMMNEQTDPAGFLRRVVENRETGWSGVSNQSEKVRPFASDLQRTVWALQLSGTEGSPEWTDFGGRTGPGPDTAGVNLRAGWIPVWKNLGVTLNGLTPLQTWPARLPAGGFAVREITGTFTPPPGGVSQRKLP